MAALTRQMPFLGMLWVIHFYLMASWYSAIQFRSGRISHRFDMIRHPLDFDHKTAIPPGL